MTSKTKSILQWCTIFGIELVDNDGFRGHDVKTHQVTLNEFVNGIASCTINPENKDKYSVLEALL